MLKQPVTTGALTLCLLISVTGCNQMLQRKQTEAAAAKTVAAQQTATHSETQQQQATQPQAENEPQAAPVAVTDIWARLRSGYQMDLALNQDRVQRDINWYARHEKYLQRVQERAEPYLFFILEELEKRNMPSELALLPVVESAFQPFAYSPGRAAGLWQFIPSTGKMYGLKQNWWYDGRRDVVAATRAALDYLKALSKEFNGDWKLALAAYNAGAGNVRRAIRRNQKKGLATDYWNLKLPQETMGYVPRLLAIASIMQSPKQHGVTLHRLDNKPYFETVDTGSQIDLALAAELADISIEELYQLNPGFNRWATAPKGPHYLNVPVDKAEQFKLEIAALPEEKRLRWTRYQIKAGDSLGLIARKHNTTIGQLKVANKLKNNRIRAGKHLLIPVAAKGKKSYTLSSEQRLAKQQNRERSGKQVIHQVASGDTLWDLARRYNVGHRSLAKWNSMAPGDTLRLGQKLVIWTESPVLSANNLTIPDTAPPVGNRSSVRYRVRKGDSLARIASKFNVSVSDLRRWNRLPGKYLQPGQRIQLYVDVTEQAL